MNRKQWLKHIPRPKLNWDITGKYIEADEKINNYYNKYKVDTALFVRAITGKKLEHWQETSINNLNNILNNNE